MERDVDESYHLYLGTKNLVLFRNGKRDDEEIFGMLN